MEVVEGYMVPANVVKLILQGRPLREQLDHVKRMNIREDDVILCSYAKCGTHWVWEIMNMLTGGTVDRQHAPKVANMMEFKHVEKLDALPSPRFLNTHLPPHLLPRGIAKNKPKIVHVYRNPKDVVLSSYHHLNTVARINHDNLPFQNNFHLYKQMFLSENGGMFYNYFKYMREINQYFSGNPDIPVHTLTYEDLSRNPVEEINRLAEFLLDGPCDPGLVDDIVDACSFNNMKTAADAQEDEFSGQKTEDGDTVIFRKGIIGDWKYNFTEEESDQYDREIEKYFDNTNIRFKFE